MSHSSKGKLATFPAVVLNLFWPMVTTDHLLKKNM